MGFNSRNEYIELRNGCYYSRNESFKSRNMQINREMFNSGDAMSDFVGDMGN
jgi:hypothetical protein